MTPPQDPQANRPSAPPQALHQQPSQSWRYQLGRLRRLTLKEVKETLRDRRTVVTLILMPLLLYPLLSVVFQQFFLASSLGGKQTIEHNIGFESDKEGEWLKTIMSMAEPAVVPPGSANAAGVSKTNEPEHKVNLYFGEDVQLALESGAIDAIVRVDVLDETAFATYTKLEVDLEFVVMEGSITGKQTVDYFNKLVERVNKAMLGRLLTQLRIDQRPVPLETTVTLLKSGTEGSAFSLASVIPLILSLMTITGAVYPAIDLTAGERERGTLEILMAAPVPRLSLLFGKYVAVLCVAILTATVNLVMMTLTIRVSGLWSTLLGEDGLTPGLMVSVFGLLVLFAIFFSAVLLSLTSFARSFKEAQAYLIPLMMMSLGPGIFTLVPGIELTRWLAVLPLVNIFMLGREIFSGQATLEISLLVVVSTLGYSLFALALAARIFGAEAVLYSADGSWKDLFRRPVEREPVPKVSSAFFCMAVMFPLSFLLVGAISRFKSVALGPKMLLAAAATCAVYFGVPLASAMFSKLRLKTAFALFAPRWLSVLGAIALGTSLWPFAHELVLWQRNLGLATLSDERLQQVAEFAKSIQALPLWLLLLCVAIVPALCEEFFFRGFVFGALDQQLGGRKTKGAAWSVILSSALLFGVFHLLASDSLAVERVLPSFFLGVALGWVRHTTGSLFPGVALHLTHNGLLICLAHYAEELKAQGIGVGEQEDLPLVWLGAAAAVAALSIALIAWQGRGSAARQTSELPPAGP